MDYKKYLAENVLNERKNVSYRLLSRELKVSVNDAKRMLYEFHSIQNERHPNSVSACYLVDGFLKTASAPENKHGNEDTTPIQSSPFISSPAVPGDDTDLIIPVRHITLCRQDHLNDLVTRYQTVESIHIYSLSSAPLKNIEVLSDSNRAVAKDFVKEDPLTQWKQYGTIQNPAVKRRTGPRPANLIQAASAPVAQPSPTPKGPGGKGTAAPGKVKTEASTATPNGTALGSQAKQSTQKAVAKQPGLQRETSDISKAFAKSKPKEKTPGNASTAKTNNSQEAPDVENDAAMMTDSEDGDSEDFASENKTDAATKGPSRSERQEALRQMMEDDEEEDEEMPDAEAANSAPAMSAEEIHIKEAQAKETEPVAEPETVVSGGRRRGRRKVMKKKTIKDEEGYLVTKEEPAWESFSEEDTLSAKPSNSLSSASSSKPKKSSGRPGQGNITSFFGKR